MIQKDVSVFMLVESRSNPVDLFSLYLSKLDPNCNFLWQKASTKGHLHYTDNQWYQGHRLGHNPLDTFMKTLSEEANLDGKTDYTNHSIRATCIRNLDRSGFEARHITAISGHKSENTVKEYSVKCPESKKKQMFNALANHMDTHAVKHEPTSTITSPQNNDSLALALPITAPNYPISLPQFNLFEMDNEDDQLFYKILTETEEELARQQNQDEQAVPNTDNDTPTLPTETLTNPPVIIPNPNPQPSPPVQNPIEPTNPQVMVTNPNPHPTPPIVNTTQLNKTVNLPLQQIQNNTMSNPMNMPLLPKMFFPHSNVTINYHINNK